MSLIQDALKRKSEETVNAPVNRPAAAAEAPTDGKNPQLILIGLIVLLTAGLLAALVGLSLYLIKPKNTVAAKPIPTVPAAPEPAATPQIPVQAVETAAVASVTEPLSAKTEPVTEIKPVWPELVLTGIAQGDGQALAILNGKMLSAGRKSGEATVVEVAENFIIVEYRGERRTLYIGE